MKTVKVIKVITALILICASLVPTFATVGSAESKLYERFADVKRKSWYEDSVEYCQMMGYMNGVGDRIFDPNGKITREQFVMILANIKDNSTIGYKETPSGFDDVPTGRWYSGAVTWAVERGYVSGISANKFGLGRAITRAELAVMLYRCLGYQFEIEELNVDALLSAYTDYAKVADWAKEGVAWAISKSIITSASSSALVINPNGTATRAQAARMITAYYESKGEVTLPNREALFENMASIYKKPQLILREIPTLKEYILEEPRGEFPESCAFIYEWMVECLEGADEKFFDDIEGNAEPFVMKHENTAYLEKAWEEFYDYAWGEDLDYLNCAPPAWYIYPGAYAEYNGTEYEGSILIDDSSIINIKNAWYDPAVEWMKMSNENEKHNYEVMLEGYERQVEYLIENCDYVEEAVKKSGAIGKNQAGAVNAIIKYISDNCDYSYWAAEQGMGHGEWLHNCLNPEEGAAVCNGYAKAFYAMCYYLGIDVEYYYGHTPGGTGHAWNSVKIDSTRYYFDVTWYDIQRDGALKNKNIWCSLAEFKDEHITEGYFPTFW